MSIRAIADLPNVGEAMAKRIQRHFRSETAALQALAEADLTALAAIEGVGRKRAVEWVRAYRGETDRPSIASTPAARKVEAAIHERLHGYASTEAGKARLSLLRPAVDPEDATAKAEVVMEAKAAAAAVDRTEVRRALRAIRTLPTPTPRPSAGRLVIAGDDEIHERLHAHAIGRWAATGTMRDLASADDYDLVVVVSEEAVDVTGVPNAVEVSGSDGPAGWCPESVIAPVQAGRGTLEALVQLAGLFERSTVAGDLLAALDVAMPAELDERALRAEVAAVRDRLDAELAARVADLQLDAGDMLRAHTAGRLPGAIESIVGDILNDGRRHLAAATGVTFQPFTAGLPLQVDDEEIDRILEASRSRGAIEAFEALQAAARKASSLLPAIQAEIDHWQAFDADFALGCFALDHDLHVPQFTDRFEFRRSIHLDLCQTPGRVPIRYRLGGDENVAVLTGANSGGKSTLLEHLCQLALMAQWGFGVVGPNVEVPWVDEVHYVTTRRGLDAGAFETFLRSFLPLGDGDVRRLVLADEVESVTELSAAGRILAFVLDRLAASDSLAVVVTHLAPQVLEHVRTASVRVDGIEARGLDDDHQLIVDRTPRMGHLARSTPELIIRRLTATATGRERQLFEALLERFEEDEPTPPRSEGKPIVDAADAVDAAVTPRAVLQPPQPAAPSLHG